MSTSQIPNSQSGHPDSHTWSPIEPLPLNWEELVEEDTEALAEQWIAREAELRDSPAYEEFYARLRRQFAIETGAIEGIYHISRGATETLIEKGIDAALLMHGDTEESSELVINRIRDQYEALGGLFQFVSNERDLSKSYIRELHQAVTRNQKAYRALSKTIDPQGREIEIEFDKELVGGEFKKSPNNIRRPDGYLFEFCPCEQVESELDRLIEFCASYSTMGVSPVVLAAWLHHRFLLIHPFPDGNGRVGRLLATLILVKNHRLPLVIVRDEIDRYLGALRIADRGDLSSLTEMFGLLQRREIRNAFSIAEESLEETKEVHSIVVSVKEGLLRRAQESRKRVENLVSSLHSRSIEKLERIANDISESLKSVDQQYEARVDESKDGEEKSTWYKYQVGQSAKVLGYFANVIAYHSWVVLKIDTGTRTEIVFSFHQLGHGESGPIVCTALAADKSPDEDGRYLAGNIVPLCAEPFDLAVREVDERIIGRFDKWFGDCIVAGLDRWKKNTI